MYIQIKNDPEAPVLMSRKLCKSLGFDKGYGPWFIQLSRIRGSDTFVIVPRTGQDTFRTQCNMVTKMKRCNRRTPLAFLWTIPSLHYFLAVTGLRIVTGKILRVKELNVNGNKYYEICND